MGQHVSGSLGFFGGHLFSGIAFLKKDRRWGTGGPFLASNSKFQKKGPKKNKNYLFLYVEKFGAVELFSLKMELYTKTKLPLDLIE